MSKTVEDLVSLFYHKLNGPDDATAEDAMRVVVTALRDEILRDYGGNNHSWCERVALGAINEILAPREGGSREAGDPLSDEARALLSSWKGHGPLPEGQQPPAAPDAPVCEWTASPVSGLFSARCQPHNAFVRPVDNCHLCGLPISFKTETQR